MKMENGKFIHFLCEEELKEELQKEARAKGLTLNGYIRMILIERNR